ncbi:WG repeat-containing protein [Actinoplanes subglobosus]|uniref:WG repeat-containing protein n=2 Tax=Actinoplanes subglobosus TaxID=1547892 RepID=A0ABV8IJM6_9ACTN
MAEAPSAPAPASEEPETHGLGWLLSMSGLGATTPVPEAEPAAPVETVEPETRPLGWFAPGDNEDGDDPAETVETTAETVETTAEAAEATAEDVAETAFEFGDDDSPVDVVSSTAVPAPVATSQGVPMPPGFTPAVGAPGIGDSARAEVEAVVEAEAVPAEFDAAEELVSVDDSMSIRITSELVADTEPETAVAAYAAITASEPVADDRETDTVAGSVTGYDTVATSVTADDGAERPDETGQDAASASDSDPTTVWTIDPQAGSGVELDTGWEHSAAEPSAQVEESAAEPSAEVEESPVEVVPVAEAGAEEESDLTRTLRIVRVGTPALQEETHQEEAAADEDALPADHAEAPTDVLAVASQDDEVTEVSDVAVNAGEAVPEAGDAAEPETVLLDAEPATVTLTAEPETVLLAAEPETTAEPVTVLLDAEAEPEPETAAIETEPATVLFDGESETATIEAEPMTVLLEPEPEPETAAIGTEPATVLLDTEPETAVVEIEPMTVLLDAEAEAEPETAVIEAEPVTVLLAEETKAGAEPETAVVEIEPATEAIVPDSEPATAVLAAAPAASATTTEGDSAEVQGSPDAGGSGDGAPAVPPQGLALAKESGTDAGGRVEPVRQRQDQRAPADRRRADPEQILASYPWAYDPQTLREQVDEPDRLWDVADRLTDRLEFAERDNVRAGLLSLRAVVHRIVGELDDALADGREGLRHAEASGELRGTAVAQARLAHVLQWRGEFEEADRLYARADSPELPPRTRAEIRELAGRSAYEQGRYLEAVNHFERALDVRRGDDPDLVERIELALDAITRRSGVAGWGPYPRTRDEVLGLPDAPVPLLDDGAGLWGYAAAVEPRFVQAQPFSEGGAWVRRPESAAWELIDPRGELIIAAAHGYVGVTGFAEGLAWVTRQDQGGWFAIDMQNRMVVPAGGFEDARPFRRGLAVVRQGGVWGAIDRNGRIAVTPRYQGFATALHVGGTVDGFSDEGLAVFDAGDRFGVLDRAGRVVVEPVHAAVVIHPMAFLVRNAAGLWGALDRAGAPLVDMGHPARETVVEALPEESRPVL